MTDEPEIEALPPPMPALDPAERAKREQEAEAALLAVVRAQVGGENLDKNPCLQRFTRALGNLATEGRTRIGAMMAIVDGRALPDMHMPQEVWVSFVRSALTTSAWAVRVEMLEALMADVARGETINKTYLDNTLKVAVEECAGNTTELNQYIMGIAGSPLEWGVSGNN